MRPRTLFCFTIPAHDERTVTLAYCNDSNGNGGYFCVPGFGKGNVVRLHSGVNQVNLSVSSLLGGLPHREAFYLQCHPNYLHAGTKDQITWREDAKFEFKRWDTFVSETGFEVPDFKTIARVTLHHPPATTDPPVHSSAALIRAPISSDPAPYLHQTTPALRSSVTASASAICCAAGNPL